MCLLLFLFLWQDEIVTEDLDPTSTVADFERAMLLYNSIDRDKAKPIFQEIAQRLENKRPKSEDERTIYIECLQWLGVLGYPGETDPYFKQIIEFDPNYEMGGRKISPKIIRHFDQLRANLVGSVRFSISESDSAGMLTENASLWVDGKPLGLLTPNETVFKILVGQRKIEIQKPNYDSLNVEIEVSKDDTETVQGVLYRNAAELQFVTIPSGVKVFLEGVEQGSTEGTAPNYFAEKLVQMGLKPNQGSDVFVISQLQPSSVLVRFEKPCYASRSFKVDIEKVEKRIFEPIVLEPSLAYLDVTTAQPISGIVYLDQERIGSLPISAHQVCPGKKTLRVQFTDGVYERVLNLEEGKTTAVVAEPLPSLVWFGIQEKEGEKPSESIDSWFSGLSSWNIRRISPNDTRQVPHDPFDLFFNPQFNNQTASVINRNVNADLYVAARVVRKKVVIRYLEIAFWSPLSPKVQIYSFDYRELDKLQSLLKNLDGKLPLNRGWVGAETVALAGKDGCTVVSVHEKGPLFGKVQPGQVIKSCNGSLLDNPADLTKLEPGKEAILEVDGQYIKVIPENTIVEMPYDPPLYCPPALIARLEKTGKYSSNELVRESARFNQARFQFFVGDFQQAFDIFSTFKLSKGYGISQGTLHFYQGLCFRQLNLLNEATQAFREASKFKNATLFDADGPSVSFWAQTQLQE